MENRYSAYLPEAMQEFQEFQKLAEIEGQFLEETAAEKDRVVHNQWILTAERVGLLRLARMMGFLGAEVMETESLREEILYRWNSRSPYTQFHLQDWLDGCLGKGKYQMELDREAYRLYLVLELSVKDKQEFLMKHLRKIIPASLILEVSLNTNTYGDLAVMTYGQMMELGWTYGQIPFEDLTPYQEK